MISLLECNPLSIVPHRNPGTVLNGQGPDRRPLGDTLCCGLGKVLSEQRHGHHFLSGVLHPRPGVVKSGQGSSHLSRRV
jgi:hypothetical protein